MKIDNNIWSFVEKTLIEMRENSDKMREASQDIMLPPESPLVEPQLKTNDLLIAALSRLIKDDLQTIEYFVYECDYGRKPLKAGKDEDMKLIDSFERLRWLLELTL